ncbi:hypothetical protein LCGC14_0125420 [marine sediment metagenome]|uniref:Pyridoxamine 5'-phosphate oxidase N-terminal domain-containing protein n=1 Tax=marine sediment metagenome TaxID=412755 RepID=A0A0F9V5E9_9ZZZZ
MPEIKPRYNIDTLEQLTGLFGTVSEASAKKEVSFIHPHYQAMIAASPFAVLATSGANGLDVSPRGDAPGFVVVHDQQTLLLPERRGNNRVDSLRNLLSDPRISLLFLIPGVGETLRVKGRARISIDPELMEQFAVAGKQPQCVLVISVETVFFQCARAVKRSGLWGQQRANPARADVPTAGAILSTLTRGEIDGEKYDAGLAARQKATLY